MNDGELSKTTPPSSRDVYNTPLLKYYAQPTSPHSSYINTILNLPTGDQVHLQMMVKIIPQQMIFFALMLLLNAISFESALGLRAVIPKQKPPADVCYWDRFPWFNVDHGVCLVKPSRTELPAPPTATGSPKFYHGNQIPVRRRDPLMRPSASPWPTTTSSGRGPIITV